MSVNTGLSIGDGLTADGLNGTPVGPPGYKIYLEDFSGFIMLEDGTSYLLQEDPIQYKIDLEDGSGFVMLENGTDFLLQEGR